MARVAHWIKVVLAAAGVSLLVSLLFPLLLTTVYKERVILAVREEFASHSEQRLADFGVKFSLLSHFPHLAIQLTNVSITDNHRQKPMEIVGIDQAHLVISTTDLFRESRTVRKIVLKGIRYKQWVDSTGQKSALTWKTESRSDREHGHSVGIPEIRIEDATVTVVNGYKKNAFSMHIQQADLSGKLVKEGLQLKGTLGGTIEYVKNRTLTLFRNQPFQASVHYAYNPATKTGRFSQSQVVVNGAPVVLTGSHRKLPEKQGTDLDIGMRGVQPAQEFLAALLPDSLKRYAGDTAFKGNVAFQFRMHGRSSATVRAHNEISFRLLARNYRWPKTPVIFQTVQLRGNWNNGSANARETSVLTLQQFQLQCGADTLAMKGTLTNLVSPVVDATMRGNLSLMQLAQLMNWPGDSLYRGTASINLAVRSPLLYSNVINPSPVEPFWQGTLRIKDGCLLFPKPSGRCTALRADIHFIPENNMLRIQEVVGKMEGRAFKINGEVTNLLRFALGGNQATHPVRTKLAAHWQELDFSKPIPARSRPSTPKKIPTATDSLLAGLLFGTEYSAVFRIDRIRLPSGEDLKDMSFVINKKGEEVRVPQLLCQTTLGGKIAGLGHFQLNQDGIQEPYAALSLSYDQLKLQRLLSLLSGLNSMQATYKRPTAQKRKSLISDYQFDIEVKARKLDYNALRGHDFGVKTVIKDETAQLERLTMNAFGGRLGARGLMKLDEVKGIPVKLNVTLQKMDLYQLFRAAEEMQIDVLKSENIRGNVDCSMTLRTELDKDFLPDMNKTTAYTKAEVRQMELIEVQPIQQALRFLPKAKTSHIYFEDVDAQFLLHKNRILMPDLNLTSNLSYLHLDGDYTLNKKAAFLVEISLTDLLFGNNKRRIRQIQEGDSTRMTGGLKNHLLLHRDLGKYRMKMFGRRDFEAQRKSLHYEWKAELSRHKIDTTFAR
ncbi:AsmA-like C-terminal region-containing protein [Larkinella insperata]|uniref:AsmA-like C-terminal region-containing protein n=1 Tax=Larkinella insperata TaxID=332158 RepID=A0ABW3Q6H2_9BACT|nr:AsmA-like C-terminal region-containing protein [Larkinella insperata]